MRPIRLPDEGETLPDNSRVVVSGYGWRDDTSQSMSNALYYVQINTISNIECNATYGEYYVSDAVVCAVGTNTTSPCRVSS